MANCPHCGGCLLLSTAVQVTAITPEQILQSVEAAAPTRQPQMQAASPVDAAVPRQLLDAAQPPNPRPPQMQAASPPQMQAASPVDAGCQPALPVPVMGMIPQTPTPLTPTPESERPTGDGRPPHYAQPVPPFPPGTPVVPLTTPGSHPPGFVPRRAAPPLPSEAWLPTPPELIAAEQHLQAQAHQKIAAQAAEAEARQAAEAAEAEARQAAEARHAALAAAAGKRLAERQAAAADAAAGQRASARFAAIAAAGQRPVAPAGQRPPGAAARQADSPRPCGDHDGRSRSPTPKPKSSGILVSTWTQILHAVTRKELHQD